MTPPARLSAAIEVLDRILAGAPAEQALTNWGRGSRYAGSGDRAAVRDLVFDALRCHRSFAALGGSETGRGLILGRLRAGGLPVEALFTGIGHAPAPLRPDDAMTAGDLPELVALDCPDWLAPALRDSLGDDFGPVMDLLRHRAPVFLRVNLGRIDRDTAQKALAAEGIETRPHPLATSALEVTGNARRINASKTYADGAVELQDAASQAVVEALPLAQGMRVLDYCAGGGGKTLAMAARGADRLYAHDAEPRRMRDLPSRAGRAGASVQLLDGGAVDKAGPFDLVLADVPCSGSGSWRRSPEGKWALGPDRLEELLRVQSAILDRVASLVAKGGSLAYATCSLLDAENSRQIECFLDRTEGWEPILTRRFTPLDGGDGFFLAVLGRI
ncbi:MAG: SAM-dependent methyltransferase [Cereibacter sphaeroides]|uniref:SAM-dependent methyltransferase n=1 Tax=Cereibacter sphaeroides TaxID=1063 RepID=A0A2W5SMR9_CERSP|nr:MAG: SAM-dependent methyltransferase [Cereibacter sphaeroides]